MLTSSRPWLAIQPFKALAMVCFLLAAPPYMLSLVFKYALPSLRPSPRLSYMANLQNAGIKLLIWFSSRTHSPRLAAQKPPSGKNRVVAVEVAPPQHPPLYTGVLAPTAKGISPAPRTAVWFPAAPSSKPSASETVVMHLPGGAFVVELGCQTFGAVVAKAMLENTSATRVVWAQYRLAKSDSGGAKNDSGSFPGAVQDALTFYAHLLSLGYDARNVVVSGDSAGANVAVALLRHLEATRALPLPRGVMAWSPWVDVTARSGIDYVTRDEAAAADILSYEFLEWGVHMYRPDGGADGETDDEVEKYLSPLHHPFKTSVPLFVHAGEAEAFYPAARTFAAEMKELNGDSVRFHGTPRALHDLILLWGRIGMRTEADAAVRDAWELMSG